MEYIRSFIALHLPLNFAKDVQSIQKKLAAKAKEENLGLRWVSPANLHITLKFLGEISIESSYAIRDKLKTLLAEVAPFSLNSGEIKAFPAQESAKVLYLGLKPDEEFERLSNCVQTINSALVDLGFDEEKKDYMPHITLARTKEAIASFWSEIIVEDRAFRANEIIFYQSELKHEGAEYRILDRFVLTAKPSSALIEKNEVVKDDDKNEEISKKQNPPIPADDAEDTEEA